MAAPVVSLLAAFQFPLSRRECSYMNSLKHSNAAYPYPWGSHCKELIAVAHSHSLLMIFPHLLLGTVAVICGGSRRLLLADSGK